ncbi:kelch repeat-containing protein [Sorangium sp. So ce1099]|uniref:kelch repeat-containing protein n=1 Tax=Sorangium sp. So ce1099 TaxID=3133331 RepID=UPI003F5F640D
MRHIQRLGLPLACAPVMLFAGEVWAAGAPSWGELPPMITPRAGHTATVLQDGRVLMAGGYGTNAYNASLVRDVEIYDPASRTWTPAAPLRTPLGSVGATVRLPSGVVLATDGAAAEAYVPALDRWRSLPRLPTSLSAPSALLLPSGKALVVGTLPRDGYTVAGSIYDPAALAWTAIPARSGPAVGGQASATLLDDGHVLVVTGKNGGIYDPESNTWAESSELAYFYDHNIAARLANGDVLIVGGGNDSMASGYAATSEVYLRERDLWVTTARTYSYIDSYCWGSGFAGIRVSPLLSGQLLQTGGMRYESCEQELPHGDPDGYPWTSIYSYTRFGLPVGAYDPASFSWSPVSAAPPATMERAHHTSTRLDDGTVLIAGGYVADEFPYGETDLSRVIATTSALLFHELPPRGAPCAADSDCASGFCADSVCCDAACAGPCDACAVAAGASQDGVCTPLSGAACNDAGACLVAGVCEAGACTGGAPAPDGTPCASGDVCAAAGACEGGACVASLPAACEPPDDCHEAPLCDAAAGCSGPAAERPDGTRCDAAGTPGAWGAAARMDAGRSDHVATLLLDGTVLVVGGELTDFSVPDPPRSTATRYDPSTDSWTPTEPMNLPWWSGRQLTATRLLDGTVLVIGNGRMEVERFDPVSGTWHMAAPLRLYISRGYTATRLLDGRVLVAGYGSVDGHGITAQLAEVYDPVSDTWSSVPVMSEERWDHSATLLPDGRVLAMGGGHHLASAEVYSPATSTWTPVASMHLGRVRPPATVLPDGRVLVVSNRNDEDTSTSEIYDPVSDTWTLTGAMAAGRQDADPVLLSDGRVLVVGDVYSNEYEHRLTRSAEIYDPASDSWTLAAQLGIPLIGHTTTRLDDERVLIAGGRTEYDAPRLAHTWLYVPGQAPVSGTCQSGACTPGGSGEGGAGGGSGGEAGTGGGEAGTGGGEAGTGGGAGGGGAAGGSDAAGGSGGEAGSGGHGDGGGASGAGGSGDGGGSATSSGSGTTGSSGGTSASSSTGVAGAQSGAGGDSPAGGDGAFHCHMTPASRGAPPWLLLLGGLGTLRLRRRSTLRPTR